MSWMQTKQMLKNKTTQGLWLANICILIIVILLFVYLFRLYVKGVFMGYQRGLRMQSTHTALIKIQDLQDRADVDFYLGKRIAYIYKASRSFLLTWTCIDIYIVKKQLDLVRILLKTRLAGAIYQV
jgi:hypothetical protein